MKGGQGRGLGKVGRGGAWERWAGEGPGNEAGQGRGLGKVGRGGRGLGTRLGRGGAWERWAGEGGAWERGWAGEGPGKGGQGREGPGNEAGQGRGLGKRLLLLHKFKHPSAYVGYNCHMLSYKVTLCNSDSAFQI